ncbi:MAG: hypothetical protein U1D06_05100, partial [Paracoccaceae bacterium]|nr:hypothetical protein [Paracoccaceae bacterium]
TSTTHRPGRISVLIGKHRYQCQDVSDAGFRYYMREYAPHLTTKEGRPTHEKASIAYRLVSDPLATMDDLVGILSVGGGISGVLAALRDAPQDSRKSTRLIYRDIGPDTRKGLSEGRITAALCHPRDQTSAALVQVMIDAVTRQFAGSTVQKTIPFEIIPPKTCEVTREIRGPIAWRRRQVNSAMGHITICGKAATRTAAPRLMA